jgi:DNA processing protein
MSAGRGDQPEPADRPDGRDQPDRDDQPDGHDHGDAGDQSGVGGHPDRSDRADRAAPFAAALAALPGAGPVVLEQILRDWTPEDAWRRILDGRLARPRPPTGLVEEQPDFGLPGASRSRSGSGPYAVGASEAGPSWQQVARRVDPRAWWARHAAAGIGVTWAGRPDYPAALVDDPERPGVLFWRGDLGHLARPCVAVVGTRRATHDGRSVAFELGRDLAAAGICVVSGLALGIDGAAHAGALSVASCSSATGPAGIAASGVDVPYPRRHAGLWEQVVSSGVMLSETLPGRPPHAWRFPARNRIIAGLAALVVVVESHAGGGSLITADAAIARGIEVRVVPGPVHSSASAGSNQLLYDGPGPVRNAQDVLDALGIFNDSGATSPRPRTPPGSRQSHPGARMPPAPGPAGRQGRPDLGSRAASLGREATAVLDAVGWQPTLLSQVVDRTGLSVGAASQTLDTLEATGLVSREESWWVRSSDR